MKKIVFLVSLLMVISLFGCEKRATNKALNNHNKEVYEWVLNQQLNNGLVKSNEESTLISLYDNALAAIIYTDMGDYERAEKVFNFFNKRINNEIKDGLGGFAQFRDLNGNPINKHRWLGDNAWLLIALNHYEFKTKQTTYDPLAQELDKWIRKTQDGDGSLNGGYDEYGKPIGIVTEGMLDAFVAVKGYDTFHQMILQYLKNNRYDPLNHRLLTKKNAPYEEALDLYSYGYLMLDDAPDDFLMEADSLLMSQVINDKRISGYSFDQDKDTIWLEGTMQMAVAFNKQGDLKKAQELIEQVDDFYINSKNNSNIGGIPYATTIGTAFGTQALWEDAYTSPCISSSVWYLFAIHQFNPVDYSKMAIPQEDQFY